MMEVSLLHATSQALLSSSRHTDMRIKVLSSGCWKKGNKSLGNLIELETDIDGAKHSIGDIK